MTESHSATRDYLRGYVALLVLLVVTVGVAFMHWGPFNIIVALTIAFIKSAIIALDFMHLRVSPRLNWVVASGAFVWLLLLVMGVMADYMTRPPM